MFLELKNKDNSRKRDYHLPLRKRIKKAQLQELAELFTNLSESELLRKID